MLKNGGIVCFVVGRRGGPGGAWDANRMVNTPRVDRGVAFALSGGWAGGLVGWGGLWCCIEICGGCKGWVMISPRSRMFASLDAQVSLPSGL